MRDSIGLGIPQACEACGLGRTKIYAAIKSGDLPARKAGRRTIILPDDLSRFVKSLPVMAVDDAARRERQESQSRRPKKAKA
jgi:excisionase family DNA binding protein